MDAMSVFPRIDPVCSRSAAAQGIATVVDARPRDLGGFTVGRVLPAEARRHVGPFVFFDIWGPQISLRDMVSMFGRTRISASRR
jgi:hypothetical protein